MKILQINKFFYPKGGAEAFFFDTAKVLAEKGHKVIYFSMKHPRNFPNEHERFFVANVNYQNGNLFSNIGSALKILYSVEAKRKIEALLREEKPDIAHLHNIYHQLSPSILRPLKQFGIPIVMTLCDHKMVCPSYLLLNKGRICHLCRDGRFYNCFLQACVKDSRMKSLINAVEMYLHHRFLRLYDLVDVFISPSRFLIEKLKEMGFSKKIVYLPNFVPCAEFRPKFDLSEPSIVYFGRLSREKGLLILLEAFKDFKVNLKIIGEGPMREQLMNKVREEKLSNVRFLGFKSGEELKREISNSMFTVLPSTCYENNPRSIIEGFALGKPALGARIGGIPELVRDNQTGLTFEAGSPSDLRAKLSQLLSQPDKIMQMGQKAREFAELNFGVQKHYQGLMQIYNSILCQQRKQ